MELIDDIFKISDQQYYYNQPSISYQELEQQLPQITSIISPGNYNCHRCGKFYDKRQSLCAHIRRECNIPRQYRCQYCGFQFKRLAHLNRHLNCVHKKK